MQQRDVRHWMWDVRDAFRRGGVERQFEIIAEALKRTPATEPGLSLRFSEANELYRFRNILAHGYHIVDHEKAWPSTSTTSQRCGQRLTQSSLNDRR